MRDRLLHLLLCLTVVSPAFAAPERPAPRSPGGGATGAATLPGPTEPGDADRLAVFVAQSGRDRAGLAFVEGLRDSLRNSARFSLATSEDHAQLLVIVVSATPAPAGTLAAAAAAATAARTSASAVSLAYVANNEWRSLLASGARFVGRDLAEQMGRDTLAELSTVLDAYLSGASR